MVRGVALDTVPDQLCRACEQFLGVRPIDVQAVGDRAVWLRFRRRRLSGGGSRGPDLAFGARLVFERPVRGPIAIGYGAHFGLGLFAAVNEDAGVES
jgi:CRISPR-associated protein Csb2